jgi:hypothetical protein
MAKDANAVRMGNAYVEITTDQSKLPSELKQVGQTVEKGAKEAGSKFSAAFAATKTSGLVAASAAVAAVSVGFKMAAEAAQQFSDTGAEIGKMARVTGFSAETVSKLRLAFGGFESMPTLTKGMATFMLQLQNGSSEMVRVANQLGVSFVELAQMAPEQRFLLLYQRIAAIKDPTMRMALGMRTFGEGYVQIADKLAKGPDYLEKMAEKAEKFGLVFSNERVAKAEQMARAVKDMGGAWEGFKSAFGEFVSPAATGALNVGTRLLTEKVDMDKVAQGTTLGPLGTWSWNTASPALSAAKAAIKPPTLTDREQGFVNQYYAEQSAEQEKRKAAFAQVYNAKLQRSEYLLNLLSPQTEQDRLRDSIFGNSERDDMRNSIMNLSPEQREAAVGMAQRYSALANAPQMPEIKTSSDAIVFRAGSNPLEQLGGLGIFQSGNVQDRQLKQQEVAAKCLGEILKSINNRKPSLAVLG